MFSDQLGSVIGQNQNQTNLVRFLNSQNQTIPFITNIYRYGCYRLRFGLVRLLIIHKVKAMIHSIQKGEKGTTIHSKEKIVRMTDIIELSITKFTVKKSFKFHHFGREGRDSDISNPTKSCHKHSFILY